MTDAEYKFEVRNRRHALGYAPQPPSPAMPTWKPVLSQQEQEARNKLIELGEIPF